MVGRELVRLCRSKGIAVNYLTTSKEKTRKEEGYSGFYWDPDTEEIPLECFDEVSAIVNLAGASISKRWTKAFKKKILSSRINSLKTLYRALETIGPTKINSFVSASAIGIYPSSLSAYYEEKEPDTDKSFLGEVTWAWEKEVDNFKKLECRVVKVRIGLVLSPDGGALPEMAKPIKNYVGAAFGSGEQWQSWIHIQDLARIFLFVIEEDLQGVFNGVAPNPVTNCKLVKEIAEVLGKPLILPNIPKFMMRLVLGEMSHLLFASQRVSSKKIEEEGFDFHYRNISSALQNIYVPYNKRHTGDNVLNKEYT